ncbi:MAG: hypothetical protein CL692_03160 [Cellvibrionales bacterium]|nr:hypothetical protein [Cellvibrionales bacterium]
MASNSPRDTDDSFNSLPTMKPAHDEVIQRRRSTRGSGPVQSKPGLTWLVIIIAIAASAGSYFFYSQNRMTEARLSATELRLSSLESRLTSAGDELTQSDEAVRVQLKELDREVRKLWDNVWKKSKITLDEHSVNIKNLTTRTTKLNDQQALSKQQLSALNGEIMGYSASLEELTENLDSLQAASQQLTAMNQLLQSLEQQLRAHDERIGANEEWVNSINSFRRQVNRQLNALSQPVNTVPELQ